MPFVLLGLLGVAAVALLQGQVQFAGWAVFTAAIVTLRWYR